MSTAMTHRTCDAGFSLIELLVVVSIIAVLAGLLIPTIAMARDSARRLQCLGNLRQFQMANLTYREDAQSWVPSYTVIPAPDGTWGNRWQDNTLFIENLTDGKVTDANFSAIPKGLLCPLAKPGNIIWLNKMVTIYGYNCAHAYPFETFNYYKGTKPIVAFTDALDMLVRYDPTVGMLNNAYIVSGGLPEGTLSTNAVAFRHRFRANAAFYDGHVESQDYQQLNSYSLWW